MKHKWVVSAWLLVPVLAISYGGATRIVAGPGCGFECYSPDQTYTTTNAIAIAAFVIALWLVVSFIAFVVWLVRECLK